MQRSGFRQRRFRSESESGENENGEGGSSSHSRMKCRSCKEEYRCDGDEAGACRKCFEKAGGTVDKHKSKSDFLELLPLSTLDGIPNSFSKVVLVASGEDSQLVASGEDSQLVASGEDSQLGTSSPPIRANWSVLQEMQRSGFRKRRFRSESESSENENGEGGSSSPSRMKCRSCKEEYRCDGDEAGMCRKCFEKAGETVDEHKSKSDFLELLPLSTLNGIPNAFSEVVLVASSEDSQLVASGEDSQLGTSSPPIRANWAVLISRSPVFRAMLENKMEESLSGTIKIGDVSCDALRAFVNYLHTAEACLDEQMARDLLVLAEKYQVKYLKTYCEEYLKSKLKWENSLLYYGFADQYGANSLLDAALSLILDQRSKRKEFMRLEEDSRLVVEICEAYHSETSKNCCGWGPEEGEDGVKSSFPLCPGQHAYYNGREKGRDPARMS